jgi:Raf kinase inhibitor-like YbhB/YbcL family protein
MNLEIINFTNNNGIINKKYLCKSHDGGNIMPSIKWSIVNGAESYVIIMEDLDANNGKCNFVHLYIKSCNKDINKIDELNFGNIELFTNKMNEKINEKINSRLIFGKNHSGTYGYYGPCNPHNYNHKYIFTIYALNNNYKSDLSDTICGSKEFEDKYKNNILKKDSKEFTYVKNRNK